MGLFNKKTKPPKVVTQIGLVSAPIIFNSRAPIYAQAPIAVQHPTESNSISASVRPYGKPLA